MEVTFPGHRAASLWLHIPPVIGYHRNCHKWKVRSHRRSGAGKGGDTEIWGGIQRVGETHLPERVPEGWSALVISAWGALTPSDISGFTQQGYTNPVSHPEHGEMDRIPDFTVNLGKGIDVNTGSHAAQQRGFTVSCGSCFCLELHFHLLRMSLSGHKIEA